MVQAAAAGGAAEIEALQEEVAKLKLLWEDAEGRATEAEELSEDSVKVIEQLEATNLELEASVSYQSSFVPSLT